MHHDILQYMATVYGKAESACSPIHDKFLVKGANISRVVCCCTSKAIGWHISV